MGAETSHDVTGEEKRIVLDTWKDMRMEKGEFSTSLFIDMVFEHPEFASYWPFVSSSDNTFSRFTSQFIREFDNIVLAINRPAELINILRKNADYHARLNIPSADYKMLQKCILTQIETRVTDHSTKQDIMKAWSNSISECFAIIIEFNEK